jgi:ABC-type Fe3+ transport system permease subunit
MDLIGKRSYVTVSGKSYRGDVQPLPVTLVWSVIALLAVWIAFNALLHRKAQPHARDINPTRKKE